MMLMVHNRMSVRIGWIMEDVIEHGVTVLIADRVSRAKSRIVVAETLQRVQWVL